MNFVLIAVIVLGVTGLISAIILYVTSKKFAVEEDPRIAEVAAVLPQANCGGCGFPAVPVLPLLVWRRPMRGLWTGSSVLSAACPS